MLTIYDIKIDLESSPMAASVKNTRFSWKLTSDKTDVFQESYRLSLFSSDGESFFDSGEIKSAECVDISFPCLTLCPASFYTVEISVTDSNGEVAEGKSSFSTELPYDAWKGKWIKPSKHIESHAPYLRKKFKCEKNVKRAVLFASGLGCAEYYINGKPVSSDYIDPPMTNYEKEVFYRAYDVTDLISSENCFAALLGDGWYSQSRVWTHSGFKYGDVCLCAELHIEYKDGDKEVIPTDESFTYKYSPIVLNNLYGGEVYDTRYETPDFALYDGDEEDWKKCKLDDITKGRLSPCNMPPVKIIREIPAVSITNASGENDGAWIIDMGENFAGIAEFHLPPCAKGSQYVFRFAETLNEGGMLDYRSSGSFATQCIQQDIYIARGDEKGEVYRPRFTYHGFRYIELTGFFNLASYGLNPDLSIATGYALSTDLKRVGSFYCDHKDIMNFHKAAVNTFLSNYHGFPEDCPAREKCGWLGDAQITSNMGILNFDINSSYEKYMNDIRTTCEVYGSWQMVSPGMRTCGEASPLWGCAQIIIPYYLYKYLGNKRVIENNFDLMEAWVEHELKISKDYIIDDGLGDWCPPGGEEHERRMPLSHSSTMIFFEICIRMQELCRDFGYKEKESYYKDLAEKIKGTIITNFYNREKHTYGYWGSDGVALTLGIYPDGEYESLLSSLKGAIIDEDYEPHTGIYANKYIVPTLCDADIGDVALKYLFTRAHKSFGTMLDYGATSVWENYDMKSVMGYYDEVSSYNHPMHAGFTYFYYTHIGGITPTVPGFKRFKIRPSYFDSIGKIDVSFDSPYGKIGIKYTRNDGEYNYEITVPANTVCEFTPIGEGKETLTLTSGVYKF